MNEKSNIEDCVAPFLNRKNSLIIPLKGRDKPRKAATQTTGKRRRLDTVTAMGHENDYDAPPPSYDASKFDK